MPPDPIPALLDAVPDPMLHIGADGTIAGANAAARTLFGDWILGRSYGAALRQPALLAQIAAVQGGLDHAQTRFERSEQTGITQFNVRITALAPSPQSPPERADARDARALLLHLTDITHLREAEEMRRDFVANVSHELRTPLTSVMGFIETLQGPAREDVAAQQRFLGIMAAETQRMNRLISDLLSLSRVEATERRRPDADVDLAGVLRSAIAALTPRAQAAGNTLTLQVDAEDATIKGDRDQVMQVVLNLTENALKYGGPDKPVALGLSRDAGGALVVSVIDHGPGIASQHLPRLTERFYRVDTHRARNMGGTGLGLAIVKHIVNRHGGRLKITSREGEGSTFTVQFPAG